MKLLHINRDIILIEGGGSYARPNRPPSYEELEWRVKHLETDLYEANIKIEEVKTKYFWTGLWVGLLTIIAFTLIP